MANPAAGTESKGTVRDMNKLMRILSAFAMFLLLLSASVSYAAADTGISSKKWTLSYSYETVKIDPEDADEWLDNIQFNSLRLGYIYSKRLEFGIMLGRSGDFDRKGDTDSNISVDYKETNLGTDVKFNVYSKSIGNSKEVALYARGYVKYLVAESEIEWGYGIYTVRETSKVHVYAPGYSIGIDFLFGKKKNLYVGLEYAREADTYAGERKLAKFDEVAQIYAINAGFRFGKSAEKPKETPGVPLMNTINGLSESDWHSVMGGRSELDLGNYRPSGNFGGDGNAWFGN